MKKVIFLLFCLSATAFTSSAQTRTPGGMPAASDSPAHNNAARFKTPQQVPAGMSADATVPGLQQLPVDPKAGKFNFQSTTHDYGTVPEGPVAVYDFKFKNTGKQPIVITDAHGSCGCTTANWPHDPILPRKSGVIQVMYNTLNRPGPISKQVIINSNAQQNPMILHITGNVTPKTAAK
jgi:uncharacterized protein DUF1573